MDYIKNVMFLYFFFLYNLCIVSKSTSSWDLKIAAADKQIQLYSW